jgi:hypothetical protein
MMGFRQFISQTTDLEETIIRKGAVALYAARGKSFGDAAVKQFQTVVHGVSTLPHTSTDRDRIDLLVKSLSSTANGLINLRYQIGSVSAQITAANLG